MSTEERQRILVVEDEEALREMLRQAFEREGYEVIGVEDGEQCLEEVVRRPPDIILLDRMLPGMEGLEVCSRLREDPITTRIPIVMLTAKAQETDRVDGLEAGADDYVVKPFSIRELIARIRALRRRAGKKRASSSLVRVGQLSIDVDRYRVVYAGKEIGLTAAEFRILRFLAERPERVHSRQDIIDGALGGRVDGLSRTIDVHLASIRRKLGGGGRVIQTVRGVGYRIIGAGTTTAGRRR